MKNLAQERDKDWLAAPRGNGIKVISYLLKSLPSHFNCKVVFIRREMEEVLASQRKMLFRNRAGAPGSKTELAGRVTSTDAGGA